MGHSAQSAIKSMNAARRTIGFALRTSLQQGRCYFAALNKADRDRLNGRAQLTHRCLWTGRTSLERRGMQLHRRPTFKTIERFGRNGPRFSARDVLEGEHVPLFDPGFGRGPGRELERGNGASRSGDTPRTESVPDADNLAVAIDEDDVDREAHEEHVYRAGPVDQHPGAGLEPIPAEQTTRPGERALGYLATLADDCAVSGAHPHKRGSSHRLSW
jgi:hypothetical protein